MNKEDLLRGIDSIYIRMLGHDKNFDEKMAGYNPSSFCRGYEYAISLCKGLISKIPDSVEVVHGEWLIYETIPTLEKAVRCSACKCITYYPKGRWIDIRLTNYCPDCGAKMDGGKNASE